MTSKRNPEQARLTIEGWRAEPERSITAMIGSALLAGEWLSSADVVERYEIKSSTVLSQVLMLLRTAGLDVEQRVVGMYGLKAYRVAQSDVVDVEHEQSGLTHPQLGAVLTVRALALDRDGELVMTLSNGHSAWSARLTGHVR